MLDMIRSISAVLKLITIVICGLSAAASFACLWCSIVGDEKINKWGGGAGGELLQSVVHFCSWKKGTSIYSPVSSSYAMTWLTYLVAFGAFEGVELGRVLGKFDIDGL